MPVVLEHVVEPETSKLVAIVSRLTVIFSVVSTFFLFIGNNATTQLTIKYIGLRIHLNLEGPRYSGRAS